MRELKRDKAEEEGEKKEATESGIKEEIIIIKKT